jgi:hypothetical protein
MKIPTTPQEWVKWLALLPKTNKGAKKLIGITSKRFYDLAPRMILFVLCTRQLMVALQRPPTVPEISTMAELEFSTHARNKLIGLGWLYLSAVKHAQLDTYAVPRGKFGHIESGVEKLRALIEAAKPKERAQELLSKE